MEIGNSEESDSDSSVELHLLNCSNESKEDN